ncbi:MAG: hypothetical protein WAU01_06715 [Saprospiraceae bacterium]
MKSIVAKLLIALCLFSFTPLKEMMKAPLLLIHYVDHLREVPDMSIADFVDMHYLQGIVFDEDYDKDMQLPFKVIDFSSLPVFLLQDLRAVNVEINETSFIVNDKINTAYKFHLSDAIVCGIFHPPKIS